MSFTATLNDYEKHRQRASMLQQVAESLLRCASWSVRHRLENPPRWLREQDRLFGVESPLLGEMELTINGIQATKAPSIEATAEAMAAAVLAGDMTAARALADWLCENVAQPE